MVFPVYQELYKVLIQYEAGPVINFLQSGTPFRAVFGVARAAGHLHAAIERNIGAAVERHVVGGSTDRGTAGRNVCVFYRGICISNL